METNTSIRIGPLKAFIGKWTTSGRVLASDGDQDIQVEGTDTYEWLPGDQFVLHKADVRIGGDRNQTLEVIGPASEANEFFMHYYDSKGERGEMTATLNGSIWTFLGNKLRFAGRFKNSDREFSGVWEQSDDGKTWSKFMEIKLLKV